MTGLAAIVEVRSVIVHAERVPLGSFDRELLIFDLRRQAQERRLHFRQVTHATALRSFPAAQCPWLVRIVAAFEPGTHGQAIETAAIRAAIDGLVYEELVDE